MYMYQTFKNGFTKWDVTERLKTFQVLPFRKIKKNCSKWRFSLIMTCIYIKILFHTFWEKDQLMLIGLIVLCNVHSRLFLPLTDMLYVTRTVWLGFFVSSMQSSFFSFSFFFSFCFFSLIFFPFFYSFFLRVLRFFFLWKKYQIISLNNILFLYTHIQTLHIYSFKRIG